MHTSLKLALGLALLCVFAACEDSAEDAPAEPERVLTLRYWQAPSLPSAYLSGGFKDRDAAAVTLEPLAHYNPEGELVAALAVEIPTLANGGISPDLTSITWTLREGLEWSDGSDVTAADVVFTWRYCVDEATGCTSSDAFSGIASVEAVDALTVRITFDAPTSYPYAAFVTASTPIISSAQFAHCIGAAATTSCEAEHVAPLGTGPYRIVSFAPNEGAAYERNPFYRGEAPYFDRVVIAGGGDAGSAARAVMELGEADYGWNLQVEPEALAALEALGNGVVVSAFAGDTERIVINHTNPDPALGDNRSEYLDGRNPHPFLTFAPIPRAMSMAIDRQAIAALYGFAAATTCNLVPGPPRYASTANDGCVARDIEGANRLLDDSGVLDADGDGIREHEGVPLRITYQTSTNAIRQDTQALVRESWARIGIEAELVHHDASVFFGGDPIADAEASYRRFFADVQMYTTGPGIDPQQYLSSQRCGHVATRDNNWADGNIARWCDPEYDRAFDELVAATADAERERLIKQLNDMLVQGHAEIPLVLRGLVSAHLNSLQGVRMNGWDSELWNIAEWRR